MLRAIFAGDIRFNECNVFEYNKETNHFHMINNPSMSYPLNLVMNDSDFITFMVDGSDTEEGSYYQLENKYRNES